MQPGSLDSEAGIFHCTYDMSGCRLITAEADKTIKVYKEDETAVSGNNEGKDTLLFACLASVTNVHICLDLFY